jgi:F420H(2)-dependent biliverdin reductase
MSLSDRQVSPLSVSRSVEAFLTEPQVAALTTLRADGSPHVAAVRFSWDAAAGVARVMTVNTTRKVRHVLAAATPRVALCQVDGFRWVTLEGTAHVSDEPERVAEGVRRYARRYWSAPPNPPGRVVMEISVDRVLSLNC